MAEDGVMPQMSANEAMWQNQANRLKLAEASASDSRKRDDYASAHSIMLSAYITTLSGKPVEGSRKFWFSLMALWHALCMFRYKENLNHNQMDVWIQFLLKLRSRLPFFRTPSIMQPGWPYHFDHLLLREAEIAVDLAKEVEAKPHQIALALMTLAEVTYAVNFRYSVTDLIERAVALEPQIRQEEGQQALRQFVRILRKAGELYAKPELSSSGWYTETAEQYLNRAMALAEGEADCPDQVPKIWATLRRL